VRKRVTYTEDERRLVEELKARLRERGVLKLPRDWHLKQLSVARTMLEGKDAPTVEEWAACMDWAFAHKFWGDKVDHLARVAALWPQYVLQRGRKAAARRDPEAERRRRLIKSLYVGAVPRETE
jgi:hypothetical protein